MKIRRPQPITEISYIPNEDEVDKLAIGLCFVGENDQIVIFIKNRKFYSQKGPKMRIGQYLSPQLSPIVPL